MSGFMAQAGIDPDRRRRGRLARRLALRGRHLRRREDRLARLGRPGRGADRGRRARVKELAKLAGFDHVQPENVPGGLRPDLYNFDALKDQKY